MSRSATRARSRARTAAARRKSSAFLDHMRRAEVSATGTHSSLGLLAAANLSGVRATVSDTFGSKRTALDVRPVPPRPVPTPKTLWQAATGDAAPAPVPDIPEGARPDKEPTPVKVGDLPADVRRLAKIAKDKGILSRDWVSLGGVERDGKTGHVYARLHGNSVRYAVEA
ncbi:hypothetical protein [Streptomyces sp. NPDC001089]